MRKKPNELDSSFSTSFNNAYLFGTRELFVAGNAPDSVAERPRGDRGDLDRVVAFEALLGSKFQSETGIVAGFRDPAVQRKKLFGAHQDLVGVEQAHGKTGSLQGDLRWKA